MSSGTCKGGEVSHRGGILLSTVKLVLFQTYLKIAHLFLEGRDAAQAEVYINRASLLVTTTTEPVLQV